MDDETRYWLAFELVDIKHSRRVENLFKMTKEQTGKIPDEFVTDGLNSYKTAARAEFGDLANYVSEIHITGRKVGKDNNKMERLNGTIRDREKTFRGPGTKHTANFHGMRVHYNHARKNGAVGSTPGEAAGIHVEGTNKWKTMIQNGSLFLLETSQRV